jgi:hypothetical protein
MTEKNEPVLTDEDWRDVEDDIADAISRNAKGIEYFRTLLIDGKNASSAIAVANRLLPDSDPRKITREWIVGLRSRAEEYRGLHRIAQPGDWAGDAQFLDRIADALESYLPPPPETYQDVFTQPAPPTKA